MNNRIRVCIVALCLSLLAPCANAWNAAGHRTIASIIFRRLTEERRQELAGLLTHHPRYQEDFAGMMPETVKNGDGEMRAEWLLQHASVWPDIVRGGPPERKSFDRPFWHYLPRAFYLTPAPPEEFRQQVEASFNSTLEPVGGTGNKDLNGPQAFKANLQLLNDESAPKADRAVALCWVLHIGQDLHQPCHTASLCMPDKFPEGDRGANSIKTEPLRNLHAVWDGPLGPDDKYETCRNLAIIMLGNAQDDVLSAEPTGGVDEVVALCLTEGLTLEESAVYVGEVKDAVMAERLPESVKLSSDYLRNVRKASDKRMLLAGIRLGKLLRGHAE